MTREEALRIIEEAKKAPLFSPYWSQMLRALCNWESLFDKDRLNNLRWDGEGGETGLYDKLKLRREHGELVEKYRLGLATAITSMCSGNLEPEQIVAIALGIEDVIAAARGYRRTSVPSITVTVHDPPKHNYSRQYEAEIVFTSGQTKGTITINAADERQADKFAREMTAAELYAHSSDLKPVNVEGNPIGIGWGKFKEKTRENQ